MVTTGLNPIRPKLRRLWDSHIQPLENEAFFFGTPCAVSRVDIACCGV